jgi:CSLREA domain-containing protein
MTVNTTGDPSTPGGGLCSLREAIENANNPGTDPSDGDCTISNGNTAITFSVNGTITLSSTLGPLPTITGTVVIDGPKSPGITVDGAGKVEIFDVDGGESLTLNHLTLAHGNGSEGGAVQNYGSLTIDNCTLEGNLGEVVGGAIYNQGGTVQITNSTLSGNEAGADGGSAIFDDYQGSVTIHSSTIAGNFGTNRPAIFENDSNSLTIVNSILADNTGGNCAEFDITSTSFSYNISDDGTCGFGTSTGANSKTIGDNVNPLLYPGGLENNGGPTETIALQSISPAIDAIPVANCLPTTDQRGAPRGGPCDIGAVEFSVAPPPPTATATRTAIPPTPIPTHTVRPTPTATPTPRRR